MTFFSKPSTGEERGNGGRETKRVFTKGCLRIFTTYWIKALLGKMAIA